MENRVKGCGVLSLCGYCWDNTVVDYDDAIERIEVKVWPDDTECLRCGDELDGEEGGRLLLGPTPKLQQLLTDLRFELRDWGDRIDRLRSDKQ